MHPEVEMALLGSQYFPSQQVRRHLVNYPCGVGKPIVQARPLEYRRIRPALHTHVPDKVRFLGLFRYPSKLFLSSVGGPAPPGMMAGASMRVRAEGDNPNSAQNALITNDSF